MDRNRCQHISGDSNQRTHTLPCRDIFCFSCLKEIPGLLKGDVFSCPICGNYSQYVDPQSAILGAEAVKQRNEPVASIDADATNAHSFNETNSYDSTTRDESHVKRGYNQGQTFGSSKTNYLPDGSHARASDYEHVTSINEGGGNQYEKERQRKYLQLFEEKKDSERKVHQQTGFSSDRYSESYKFHELDLNREQSVGSHLSNNPRSSFLKGGSIREDQSPRMEDRTDRPAAVNAHPSDYSSLPEEVVGNISADELQKQDEWMHQITQNQQTQNEMQYDDSGRAQVLYDNVPHQEKAVGSTVSHEENNRVTCKTHNSQAYSMYCPTCNTMLCKECLLLDAHKHNYSQRKAVPVKSVKYNLVTSFEKYKRNLSSVRKILDTEYTRMEEDTAEIFRKAEEMKKQIDVETENACKKLQSNAEDMKNQVDEKVKQLFATRESHSRRVGEVKKKLDESTELVHNTVDYIEANNIPLAISAQDEVENFIRDMKDLKLYPPKDTFDLEFRSREIPDSSSTSAPIYLKTNRWSYNTVVAGPVYFYVGLY